MAVTTQEWWSIDGVPLNQYGWNIKTVGGSRYGVPTMRGTNVQYAYVPGNEFRAKIPDSRVITLDMWVTGVDPDTGNTTPDTMLRWNDSWQFLRHLLWQPNREFVLTRRWLLSDSNGDPVVQTASALGQISNDLGLSMTGRARGEYSVDIVLADPFFYGTDVITQVDIGTDETIVNPGDYIAAHQNVSVQLVGPLNTPTLTNLTAAPNVSVTLNTSVSSGETVTLDMHDFSAISDQALLSITGIGTYNRIAYITHAGARQWFGLLKGDNEVRLTATSGSGHAIVRFAPPYV